MTTNPPTPNFRALCEELVNELHAYKVANPNHTTDLIDRARAALATPPPAPPTELPTLLIAALKQHAKVEPEPPTADELNALWNCCGDYDEEGDHYGNIFQFARAVINRWGAK